MSAPELLNDLIVQLVERMEVLVKLLDEKPIRTSAENVARSKAKDILKIAKKALLK